MRNVCKKAKFLEVVKELWPRATATDFDSVKVLKECTGFSAKSRRERLITRLAGYASHKIIHLEFGSLCTLKGAAGTYTSNKNEVVWPDIHAGDGCLPKMTDTRQYRIDVVKLPVGNKDSIGIPEIILNSPDEIRKAFVCGLADTDFSLVFGKKHKIRLFGTDNLEVGI